MAQIFSIFRQFFSIYLHCKENCEKTKQNYHLSISIKQNLLSKTTTPEIDDQKKVSGKNNFSDIEKKRTSQ